MFTRNKSECSFACGGNRKKGSIIKEVQKTREFEEALFSTLASIGFKRFPK